MGQENTEPKFMIENLKVIKSNVVGENHIKLLLIGDDGSAINAFAPNAKNTPLEPFLLKNKKKKINIAGKMTLNNWQGKKKVEFMIEDILAI